MFQDDDRAGSGAGHHRLLRPETAQGIFLNFKHYLQFARKKPPVRDRADRQELPQRDHTQNFIFRMREFEQMEMEYFVPPAEAEMWFQHWLDQRMNWYVRLGLRPGPSPPAPPRCRRALALTPGPPATSEYLFPGTIGWLELEGIANRGDFDLTSTPSTPARSSNTSIRPRASATYRT